MRGVTGSLSYPYVSAHASIRAGGRACGMKVLQRGPPASVPESHQIKS